MTPSSPVAGLLSPGRSARAHVAARRAALVVGLATALAGWWVAGSGGLVAGLVGTGVVVGFFWAGMIPLFVVRERAASMAAGLGVLLLTYTLRLALALIILRLSRSWGLADDGWLGLTVIAVALTWIAVHVFATFRRSKA